MIYATSDLHGYPLPEFQRLLDKARFSDGDFLFVLGDVVDRNGDGGIAMLEWMMLQPNVQLVLGNHEAMLLSCGFLFQEITDDLVSRLDLDHPGRRRKAGGSPDLERPVPEAAPAAEVMNMQYGQIVATRGVADLMERDAAFRRDLAAAFQRYQRGDWGEVCPEDWALNDQSAQDGERILAAYTCAGVKVWIITEWDRSVTTFLFPDEY